ncbi:tRNA lysidine(34) synthetase TilS [Roseococcus sp. SDR]|uniref:tRNA lysidine(34) synthetase TilS n=1 Tax=Roseococcus sp. SDR TaxID=2835532 RepID=UPI001BCCF18D|nr:tRNA lysidine(34) synthetase TilS [Roseococcus sp. SDR]MBS7792429.1 tRNA lysidine(34) synthetase TilS [Roseococcus sp. SDR]MBV1847743.1 tRNA lysidine(34) synthetase TilS [Roseococcus sp. SDR]
MSPLGPFAGLIAVGCSGGPDSLALTRLADRWARQRGVALLALIVDHGLRPESAAEAEATAMALTARGIATSIIPLALPPGPRLQERARAARRSALLAACAGAGAPHLLLAHHAEDQAETILFRALRGSTARGLAGMAPVTVAAEALILRPLLGEPKARLAATLADWGVTPVQDPSNDNPRFARARLREAAPGPLDATAFVRRRARHAGEEARRLVASVRLLPEGCAEIDRAALGRDRVARRVMTALIRAIGGAAYAPPERAVAAMLMRGSGTLGGARWLSGGRWLVREAATGGRDAATGLWDGRFRCPPPPPGFALRPLGTEAARFRPRFRHLPASALAALPALWREGDGMLALVPHLAYHAHGSALFEPVYFAPLAGPVTESHPSGDFHGPRAFSRGAPTPCSPYAGSEPGEGECDT